MTTMGSPDIPDVLELVRTWTHAMSVTLARKVLETLGRSDFHTWQHYDGALWGASYSLGDAHFAH